ncbi:hypothetical protein D9M73_285930 [compost metagenome]
MEPLGFPGLTGVAVRVLSSADGNDYVLTLVITEDHNWPWLLDLIGNRSLILVSDVLRLSCVQRESLAPLVVQHGTIPAEKTFVYLTSLDPGIHCWVHGSFGGL